MKKKHVENKSVMSVNQEFNLYGLIVRLTIDLISVLLIIAVLYIELSL